MLWSDIAIDFVKELPCVSGKSVILTVVDRFSKSAHFIALGHPYTSNSLAWAFFVDNVRLHGIPSSIVSDQDQVFTSTFWRDLFTLARFFAFHLQSNGQSEATNKIIAMYLRCLTGDRPRHWLQQLPLWARLAFTTFYEPVKHTFRLLSSNFKTDEFLVEIRERLEQAQQYHKSQYDKQHREVTFHITVH